MAQRGCDSSAKEIRTVTNTRWGQKKERKRTDFEGSAGKSLEDSESAGDADDDDDAMEAD